MVSCKVNDETGDITLENEHLRFIFKKSEIGYKEFMIYVHNGSEWYKVGLCSPIARFTYKSNALMNYSKNINPTSYKINEGDNATLELYSKEVDVDGVEWNFQFKFSLKPNERRVLAKYAVTASKSRQLLFFSGPFLYVGEGSFGANKDLAIFPGLEYLLSNERSSSKNDVAEVHMHRFLPHPYKITLPLMFVSYKGYVLGLAWNPLYKWDGRNAYISAIFASPNWVEMKKKENHLLGLFVPSVPKWINENCGGPYGYAYKSYFMEPNHPVNIEAWIIAGFFEEPIQVLKQWFEIYGIPEIPATSIKPEKAIEISVQTYLDRFDSEKHVFSQNVPESWGPHASPLTSLQLWIHSLSVNNPHYKNKLREVAIKAMRKFLSTADSFIPYANGVKYRWWTEIGSRFILLDLSLHAGLIEECLKVAGDYAKVFIANQRPDGSFGFLPDESHKILGEAGDTAVGLCAFPAYNLLKYARFTGDQKSLEAGLKALNFMNTLKRPEGSQTWECPLHTPDIVASAQAILANLEAFKITGNDEYLSKAVFWAYTGLPFIYTWGALDRRIMKYGSIPVFGSTFYLHPWFGQIVQWCGLEYAYSLRLLSDYDDSLPWKTFADGITMCGLQQQAAGIRMCEENVLDEKYRGYYPDSYDVINNVFSSYWLAPGNGPEIPGGNLLSNLMMLTGKNVEASFSILNVGKKKVYINSAAIIQDPKFDAEKKYLTFKLNYPINETSFSIIAGLQKPEKVTRNGVEIAEVSNIDVADEGWKYLPEQALLLIKSQHLSAPTLIKVFLT
ncbi:MAG: hypothetical protein DRJ64_00225 [Thermoprotei archaeon]|nr:MAG: hypothetical protein DRJ64_00225 [Thermoprotei archaeon]